MIRVLVVDDEKLAVQELVRMIEEHSDFKVIDTAAGGNEALTKLKQTPVDVVFLDIEMPGLSGLEVASRIADWPEPPLVVFATAYNQYAVEAFEAHAMDYLLKPYESSRLEKTLQRIRESRQRKESQRAKWEAVEEGLIRHGLLKKIVAHRPNSRDRLVLDPAEVIYFTADGATIWAAVGKERLEVNTTLRELGETLDPARFVQTHKSYIVNLDRVKKVSPMFSGNFEIVLNVPELPNIPLSRRFARGLKARLGSRW